MARSLVGFVGSCVDTNKTESLQDSRTKCDKRVSRYRNDGRFFAVVKVHCFSFPKRRKTTRDTAKQIHLFTQAPIQFAMRRLLGKSVIVLLVVSYSNAFYNGLFGRLPIAACRSRRETVPNYRPRTMENWLHSGKEDDENIVQDDVGEPLIVSEAEPEQSIPLSGLALAVAFVMFWPLLALLRVNVGGPTGGFDIDMFMALKGILDVQGADTADETILELPPLSPAEQLVDAIFGPP